MTGNKSQKPLLLIIAVLLAANIFTVSWIFLHPQRNDSKHGMMRSFLKDKVGFTDAQLVQFDSIKAMHKRTMGSDFELMKADKVKNLAALSAADFSDSALHKAAESAGSDQTAIEFRMLSNLRLIRQLCTPEQRPLFDSGFYKIMSNPPGDPSVRKN